MFRSPRFRISFVACMILTAALAVTRAADDAPVVPWDHAAEHVGKTVTVEGPVVEAVYLERVGGKPTFLNVGKTHHEGGGFTVVIWGKARAKFTPAPENTYNHKTIRVTGKITLHHKTPQIEVTNPNQITIVKE